MLVFGGIMGSNRSERGAVAVEFALLVPVLLLLMIGIVEFSRAFNAQISVTQAAREAARTMAIENDPAAASARASTAAPGLNPPIDPAQVVIAPTDCDSGDQVTAIVTYTVNSITGIFGPFTLTGEGAMRCGG